jgi:hypothetical protein
MSIPKIDIFRDDSLATLLGFGARPLGGSSNPIEIEVWNDKPATITNESVGTGDGLNPTFGLAHGNIYASASLTVKVAGVTKTETTQYTVNRTTGVITFLPGHIPTAGQAVTASYSYGTGAGTASDVYLLARRRETFVSSGSAAFTLAVIPSMVYEVTVDDVLTDDYTTSDNVVTLGSAPGSGSMVVIIYEDESCSLQMIQVKSSGVTDPFSQSPVDDAESAYIGIGGHADVSGESVGTGDDSTVIFNLDYPCIIDGTLEVEVDGSPVTNFTLDPIRGEIEFDTAPGDTLAITASYSRYKVHEIGAIPAACARKIQTRGHAATTATQGTAEASLEVWAV